MNKKKLLIHVDNTNMNQWLKDCVKEFGGGFHPDTNAIDYINPRTNKLIFKQNEARIFNTALSNAFDICNTLHICIYQKCLKFMKLK